MDVNSKYGGVGITDRLQYKLAQMIAEL